MNKMLGGRLCMCGESTGDHSCGREWTCHCLFFPLFEQEVPFCLSAFSSVCCDSLSGHSPLPLARCAQGTRVTSSSKDAFVLLRDLQKSGDHPPGKFGTLDVETLRLPCVTRCCRGCWATTRSACLYLASPQLRSVLFSFRQCWRAAFLLLILCATTGFQLQDQARSWRLACPCANRK